MSCCDLVAQWRVLSCSVVWRFVDVRWCVDVSCCVAFCCDVRCCLVLSCEVSCVFLFCCALLLCCVEAFRVCVEIVCV